MPSLIGPIVRLQVQRSPLKVGAKPHRVYTTDPITAVRALHATADGVIGVLDGGTVIDIHHRTHCESRNSDGANGISIGFTSHYRAMQARFGAHMAVGVAGENVIVETDRTLALSDIARGLVIVGADGHERCRLTAVTVAAPCREFSGYALGGGSVDAAALKAALQFLDGGMRGFYAAVSAAPETRIEPGDTLCVVD